MSARVIRIEAGRRGKALASNERRGSDSILLSKTDSQVLLTVGEFECTLTPAEAGRLGVWLTTYATLLGAK